MAAVAERGWSVVRLQDSETFVRLHLHGRDEVRVDIGIDVAAKHPPVVSVVGPTFAPEELAGRKLAALFGRAEARDFADVYVLAQHFGRTVLLEAVGIDSVLLSTDWESTRRIAHLK